MSRTTNRTISAVEVHLNDGALRICTLAGDIEAEVHFDYEPEEKGCYTMPNGDPGYPGYAASVHITKVITTQECTLEGDDCKLVINAGVDVREYLTLRQIAYEEEEILESFEARMEDARHEAEIDRYLADREFA